MIWRLGLLLAGLLSGPVGAESPGPIDWAFPSAFLGVDDATPAQRQRILSLAEAWPDICKAHRGAVPLILGTRRLDVGCNVFVYAGTVERYARPTAADAPFVAFRLAMTLEREPASVLIWEPFEGPSPLVGAPIFPADCRPLVSGYEWCGVSAGSPHSGEWDLYIRRERLESDDRITSYNENFLMCRAVETDLHCEFFDNTAQIVEVRVLFRTDRDIGESALIGHFRNLQQRARIQTSIRLQRFGAT